jgi:uncharacterized membrane protein
MSDEITKSIIVRAPSFEVYGRWRDIENLPKAMKNIVSVRKTGERTSRWVARGPLGVEVEWDVEMTTDQPGRRIGWNSRDGEIIHTTGQVTFTDLKDGQTEVTVLMRAAPRGGKIAEKLVSFFANPGDRIDEDLRAFKQAVEGTAGHAHGSAGMR